MQDKIEKIGKNSLIQHGKLSDRIYLMKLETLETVDIIQIIDELARKNKYSKIFCKVPASVAPIFTANGFISEAHIPHFFNGDESAFFMSKFLSSDRLLAIEAKELRKLSELLKNNNSKTFEPPRISKRITVRKLTEKDSLHMTELYKNVFQSYPFPIFDSGYIQKTMKSGVQYFGIEKNGQLVALASSEVNAEAQNAEMTDFATLPSHRGKKYAYLLLKTMEEKMKEEGIKTVYTIARLRSVGMNLTFLRMNYEFAGTLLKNTNISGDIESMIIYYKRI